MRARSPDWEATIDSSGVDIHVEVHGAGHSPTLVLVPPSPITDSRIWKAVLPTLARNHRVVTFDGRGSGRSGRPGAVSDHTRAANVADIVAVLDATDTDVAVVVAHCHANWWAVDLAAEHPDRVAALVSIAPGVPYLGRPQPHWVAGGQTWDHMLDDPHDWELFNRHVITSQPRRWIEFFFSSQLVEPHSTKQFQDAVAWAMETTGQILAAGEEGQDHDPPGRQRFEARCRSLDLPVLVIHGDLDVCQHVDKGRAFAELTRADLVEIHGGGHLGLVRDPVQINLAISRFLETRVPVRPMRATDSSPAMSSSS
jgi:pimeloyl-ACP methyl ester carboxylesterase